MTFKATLVYFPGILRLKARGMVIVLEPCGRVELL